MRPIAIIMACALVAALAAIFLLTRQSVQGTRDLAWRAEHLLARIVPPTGTGSIGEPTWCGLTIRRLAHLAEFGLLGLIASLGALSVIGPRPLAACSALGLCLAVAVADEAHKLFVPGRHFDLADVLLDIAGFAPVTLIVFAIAHLVR